MTAEQITSLPWVAERIPVAPVVTPEQRGQAADVELDTDGAISRARELLKMYATSEREISRSGKQKNGPAVQGAGGDEWTLQVAMNVGDLGISPEMCSGLMFELFNPSCTPQWDVEGEYRDMLMTKINSAYKTRQTPPGSNTAEADFGAEPEEEDDALDVSTPKASSVLRPLTLLDFKTKKFERSKYILAELIMQGVVNTLDGDGGVGKTTAAIQIGISVGTGLPLWGRSTIKTPVLMVLSEDKDGDTQPRVLSTIADLKITDEQIAELGSNCEICPVPGEDISIARIDEKGTTVLLPFYYELEAKLKARPTGLFVVLDNLVDIAQMSEAGRLEPTYFFKRVLGGLAKKYDATFLVLAHPSKAAMKDGNWYSGSTGYKNAVRNKLVMKFIKGSVNRSLSRLKNNYAPPKERIILEWVNEIFVMAETSEADDVTYRLVINKIKDMIGRKLNVADNNRGTGQTPRSVAAAMQNAVPEIDEKDVLAAMQCAVDKGDLEYVEGYGRIKATFAIPKVRPADPNEFEETEDDDDGD